jgi:putative peptidoglycan lipid II flippase
VTLGIWSAQGIYARAFYAAGNARTPLIAGSIVTVLSLPIYWSLFRSMGPTGLSIASDIGMTAYTITLAVLLHKKRLVSLAHLEFGELGRALLASLAAFAAAAATVHFMPPVSTHPGDVVMIAVGSVAWAIAASGTLIVTGSKLPEQVLRRRS